jgi:hypothetical protein
MIMLWVNIYYFNQENWENFGIIFLSQIWLTFLFCWKFSPYFQSYKIGRGNFCKKKTYLWICLQYQIYLLEPIIPEKLRLLYNDALSLIQVSILHTSILSHFSFLNYEIQNSACSWLVCMYNEFFYILTMVHWIV